MKKTLLIAASFTMLTAGFAQQGDHKAGGPHKGHTSEANQKEHKTPEQNATMQAERLEKLLALTADQKQKVYAATLEKDNNIKAFKEAHKDDADKSSAKEEIKAEKLKYDNALKAILTKEQNAKLEEHKAEMKAHASEGKHGHEGKPGMSPEERAKKQTDALDSLVKLTSEQKVKVQAAALKKQSKIHDIKEAHKMDEDKEGIGEEIKAARDEYQKEIDSILTAEQKAKLKEVRGEKKEMMKGEQKGIEKAKKK